MAGGKTTDPSGTFRVYWASRPAPPTIDSAVLNQLIPVEFTTEEDALHAAALLLRANDHVWRIERPDGAPMEAEEIKSRCAPLLQFFNQRRVGDKG